MDQFITEECPSYVLNTWAVLFQPGFWAMVFSIYMIVQSIGDLVPSLRIKTECYNTLASFPGSPLALTKNKNKEGEPST